MKRKFTKAQEELALKISNDISEDIDCGETKKQLRMAVKYWADAHCETAIELNCLKTTIRLFGLGQQGLKEMINHFNECDIPFTRRTAKAKGGGE